jgi:hypothetical protein
LPEYQRSVVLFNTWPYKEDSLLIDYEITNATITEIDTPINKKLYGCNPKSDWIDVDVIKYQPPAPTWWFSFFQLQNGCFKFH